MNNLALVRLLALAPQDYDQTNHNFVVITVDKQLEQLAGRRGSC